MKKSEEKANPRCSILVKAHMKDRIEKMFSIALKEGSDLLFSQACNDCFEQYSRLVYFLAIRELKSEEDAKDIVMETFTLLFERKGKILDIKDIKNYLCATAKHLIASTGKQRNVIESFDENSHAGCDPYFDNAFYEEGVRRYGEDFDLLIDHYVFGKSYKDIGAALGLNEKTVATKVRRTTAKARKDLKKYYE